MHGGTATLAQSVPVREIFEGKTVWEGVVRVFDLSSHPTATRAYAWSSPIEDSAKRRFFAVLHTERINSPLEAVWAAIVAEQRAKGGDQMADDIDYDAFDPLNTDKAKIQGDAWVPCRICWDIFMRLTLTSRYCASCERAFCEGNHGNFAGGTTGVCVRCFRRAGMQLKPN